MRAFYTIDQLDELPADAKVGVIGNPIAHSKSPQMQQPALDAAGTGLRSDLMSAMMGGAME